MSDSVIARNPRGDRWDLFAPARQLTNIISRDTQRVQQKKLVPGLIKKMKAATDGASISDREIAWIAEELAQLSLKRYVVEYSPEGTWFFKMLLATDLRVNVQVDRDDDAFVSVRQDDESKGLASGTLKEIVASLSRYRAS